MECKMDNLIQFTRRNHMRIRVVTLTAGITAMILFTLLVIHPSGRRVSLSTNLVEQNADASLNAADYVYIMHEGTIKAEGSPEEIKGSQDIREAFLGI